MISKQYLLMCERNKKSGATGFGFPDGTRLHAGHQGLHLFEHVGDQLVVHPTPVLTIADDPGVLEHAQMERQPRLRGIECIGQLANTTLAFAEQLDDLESGLVGEGVEELYCSIGAFVSSNGHGSNISRKVAASTGTATYDYRLGAIGGPAQGYVRA